MSGKEVLEIIAQVAHGNGNGHKEVEAPALDAQVANLLPQGDQGSSPQSVAG